MSRSWSCAWITGASSGIGRELALELAPKVKRVAVSARSADKLDELATAAPAISAFPLDVTDREAVAETVAAIERTHGEIDLAVLNAAAWTLMDSDALDAEALRRGVEVNYMGVLHAVEALVPRMIARGAGQIVIVASVAGYRGLPRSIAYGPTKAALINMAEILRAELAPRGIVVSLVNPGFVDTPATRRNPFPMPALMKADAAARAMIRGMASGRFEITFPWRFTLAMKALAFTPYWLFFRIMRRLVPRQRGT